MQRWWVADGGGIRYQMVIQKLELSNSNSRRRMMKIKVGKWLCRGIQFSMTSDDGSEIDWKILLCRQEERKYWKSFVQRFFT